MQLLRINEYGEFKRIYDLLLTNYIYQTDSIYWNDNVCYGVLL